MNKNEVEKAVVETVSDFDFKKTGLIIVGIAALAGIGYTAVKVAKLVKTKIEARKSFKIVENEEEKPE